VQPCAFFLTYPPQGSAFDASIAPRSVVGKSIAKRRLFRWLRGHKPYPEGSIEVRSTPATSVLRPIIIRDSVAVLICSRSSGFYASRPVQLATQIVFIFTSTEIVAIIETFWTCHFIRTHHSDSKSLQWSIGDNFMTISVG
jgi:hypothetical protein